MVDAEEVNYATFAGQSHYEIVKNFSEIGMYPYTCFIYFNSSVYDNLPDGYADLMQAVMNEQEYIYLTAAKSGLAKAFIEKVQSMK